MAAARDLSETTLAWTVLLAFLLGAVLLAPLIAFFAGLLCLIVAADEWMGKRI